MNCDPNASMYVTGDSQIIKDKIITFLLQVNKTNI